MLPKDTNSSPPNSAGTFPRTLLSKNLSARRSAWDVCQIGELEVIVLPSMDSPVADGTNGYLLSIHRP